MAVEKTNSSSSLAEVIDRILDKGIVIDAWARVSLVGIELLAIEARVVIASVETYARPIQVIFVTVILTFVARFTVYRQNVRLTIFLSRKPFWGWDVAPLSLG